MFIDRIIRNITEKGDKAYFINTATGNRLSFSQVGENASSIYQKMELFKLSAGTVVSVMLTKADLMTPTLLACWKKGWLPAILDFKTPFERYQSIKSVIKSELIITDGALPAEFADCEKCVVEETLETEEAFDIPVLDESKPALILFSSGTTGVPKCIPLSFSNLADNMMHFHERLNITDEDVLLCLSSFWYAHGLYNSLLSGLFLGSTVVSPGVLNLLNAELALKSAVEHHATVVHVSPSMLPILTMAGKRTKLELPRFRWVISGTAKLMKEQKKPFEEIYQTPVTQQMGMSESLFMTVNDEYQHDKPDSVGSPVGCEFRIQNSDGDEVENGTEGEILIRSGAIFGEYYNQPEETKQAFHDGWFRTGDLGYFDEDGYLFITGRIKEMIKKGGFNINPFEIESVLKKLPNVTDAAVVGAPDANYGEEIYAFVTGSNLSEVDLLEACQKDLHRNYWPKRIFVENSFPKTTSGKIMKNELRKKCVEFD